MDTNNFRVIPGFNGRYMINSRGEVISNARGFWNPLTKTITERDYVKYKLTNSLGSKRYKAHRLVMLTFIGPSELEVDHLDNDRQNNCLSNLEYVTRAENVRRAKVARAGKGYNINKEK